MMESITIEYKRNFGKEVIISLVAFANSSGGRVTIGMNDDGTPCGVEIGPETVQRYLNEIKVATYPQLMPKAHVDLLNEKHVVIFEVSEFPIKPVSYKNRYYKRVHNSNHLMTLEDIVALQQESLSVSFDSYPVNLPLSIIDMGLVERFFSLVNKRGRFSMKDDPLTNLSKLKFIRDGRLALATVLLFGDHDYSLHIGRFKSESTIIDDLVIKTPLFTAVDEATNFIKRHINLGYTFDGNRERIERWQYPMEAIRELLLNSIVHRDYKSSSDIVIKIFDDRIIFSNPGRIFGNLKIQDLQRDDYVSSIRNRLLAEAFYLTGDIERYGTGFIRIREALKAYPEFGFDVAEIGDYFLATLKVTPQVTPQVTPPISEERALPLTALEQKILECLIAEPKLSRATIAARLGVGQDTVKEYLGRLKKKGMLLREGNPKSGSWRVTESGKVAIEEK